MKRRVKCSDRYWPFTHLPEDTQEVIFLIRENLAERPFPFFKRIGQYHLPYSIDPVAPEKHVLGSAQPYTFCSECYRVAALIRLVSICPYFQCPVFICPCHYLIINSVCFRFVRAQCSFYKNLQDLCFFGIKLSFDNFTRCPVNRDPFPLF